MDVGVTILNGSPAGLPRALPGAAQGRAAGFGQEQPGLRAAALLTAAAFHIAVVAAFGLEFHARQLPPAPPDSGVKLVLLQAVPAEPDAPPQLVASATVPTASGEVPDTLSPLPPVSMNASETGILPPPRLRPQRRTPTRATPVAVPHDPIAQNASPTALAAAPAARPATPSPASPSGDPREMQHALASWEARIRQAVQDATVYPASARMLHREGMAQVRFNYVRGAAEDVAIAQSSASGALDTAAMAAVSRAVMPEPPAGLGPQRRVMLVWVQFKLIAME